MTQILDKVTKFHMILQIFIFVFLNGNNNQSIGISLFIIDSHFYPVSTADNFSGPPGMGNPMMTSGGNPTGQAPHSQPLPSNVLGKGGDRTLDQQYMQQSSQIFVFSTDWANRSAQAVAEPPHEYPSIIAWHESQPETKKQLEVSEN